MPDAPSPMLTVEEALRRWPQLAGVFLRQRLACTGCAMAPFDTLRDVAQSYGINLAALLNDVERAAGVSRPR